MKSVALILALVLCCFSSAQANPDVWDQVQAVFAQKGKVQGDVLKLTFPRSDLSVKLGEVTIEPGLGLTSWIGFRTMGHKTMMMGDMVLLEQEVGPVTAKLVAEGLQITALHNHLIGTHPAVMYLHFGGEGNPGKLAAAMHAVLSVTGTPLKPAAPSEAAGTQDWGKVEKILGKPGQKKGDLLLMSFNRKEKIKENGMEVPPFLGVSCPINFQMVGAKAASTGDFVLTAKEVNPVIKALVEHGIAVTAVHNHMLNESPRLFFLHFWGYDQPEKVAAGLRAALNQVNLAK